MRATLLVPIIAVTTIAGLYLFTTQVEAYPLKNIIARLAERFKVSPEAIRKVFRRLGIGTISERYADTKIKAHRDLYIKYGRLYGVDHRLPMAISWVESKGDPQAIRYEPHLKDASVGIMQTLVKTACEYCRVCSLDKLKDVETSIRCGIAYLSHLQKRFVGLESVISAYNAGRPTKGNILSYVIPVVKKIEDFA